MGAPVQIGLYFGEPRGKGRYFIRGNVQVVSLQPLPPSVGEDLLRTIDVLERIVPSRMVGRHLDGTDTIKRVALLVGDCREDLNDQDSWRSFKEAVVAFFTSRGYEIVPEKQLKMRAPNYRR